MTAATTKTQEAKEAKVDTKSQGSLADLQKNNKKRGSGICPACGNDKTKASVLIHVRSGKEHITSTSRSLCEACTVKAFDLLGQELNAFSMR